MGSCQVASIRPGLKPIGPIAPNLMPRLLSTVQVHTTTHCWSRCHKTFSLLSKLFLLKSVFSANQIWVFPCLRIFSDLSKFSSFMAPGPGFTENRNWALYLLRSVLDSRIMKVHTVTFKRIDTSKDYYRYVFFFVYALFYMYISCRTRSLSWYIQRTAHISSSLHCHQQSTTPMGTYFIYTSS